MLADMVKAGKLPPVAERLPQNPLVIKPVNEIGKYGGRIRTFSPSDTSQAVELWQYGFSPLRWDNDATKVGPNACETWSTNADNTEWTLNFRKGLKWSDGQPCNVDDVMFWWNDLIQNPDFAEKPSEFGLAGGKPAVFTKVDDYTLKIKYQVPSPLTPERLAMWCKGSLGPRWIVPKHYLQQFHPAYNKSVTGLGCNDQTARMGALTWSSDSDRMGRRGVHSRRQHPQVDTQPLLLRRRPPGEPVTVCRRHRREADQ